MKSPAHSQVSVTSAAAPQIVLAFDGKASPFAHLSLQALETRHRANRIPFARIVLAPLDSERAVLSSITEDAKRCRPGARVSIGIWSGPVLFEGVVTSQDMRISQNRIELVVKARHVLQRLAAVRRTAVFLKRTDAAIIRELVGAHTIKLKEIKGLDAEREQVIQFRTSDWAFLKARLAAHAVWLLPSPEGIEIVQPNLAAKADHVLRPDRAEIVATSLEEIAWRFSNLDMPASLTQASWQVSAQELSPPREARRITLGSGGLDPADVQALNPAAWTDVEDHALSPTEEGERGAAELMSCHLGAVTLRLATVGTTTYGLGQTIELSGFSGGFDGRALISGVSHVISASSWRTIVEVGEETDVLDVVGEAAAITGLHVGVIAPVQNDPKDQGRVQVSLPVLGPGALPIWARVATAAAGKSGGFCFHPEPGDEVAVGFFGGQIDQPVILGSMFNPTNPAPIAREAEGGKGGLVLSDGDYRQSLIFDMRAKTLTLETSHGRLALAEQTELVRTDGPVIALAEGLAVTAKSLDLKIEDATTLAAGSLEAKAREQAVLTGSAGVKISGASIDLTR